MPSWQSHILRLLQHLYRISNQRSPGLDVEKDRRNMEAVGRFLRPVVPSKSSPVVAGGVPAEWLVPVGILSDRVLLYLHGGAFNAGSIAGARSSAANVAHAAAARALLIDYRLAPEHPFPAAVEDTLAAYEWLLAAGIPAPRIAVVGESAGGTLALALLIRLRDEAKALPGLAVCVSPATDLTMSGASWRENSGRDLLLDPGKIHASIDLYLHQADPQAPLASPLFADLRGLPPLLMQVGSDEFLLSDSTRLAEKAEAEGVSVTLEVWPGMQHGWHIMASFLPEARSAIARIGQFIRSVPPIPVAAEQDWNRSGT